MLQWVQGTVVKKKFWHNNLFSLTLQAPPVSFIPGQFIRLGLAHNTALQPKAEIQTTNAPVLHRAYSLVNAPDKPNLEFFIAAVEAGQVSPALRDLAIGEPILLSQHAAGFFTLEAIPNAASLWLIATGTGLGPYLSILNSVEVWQRFDRIVLVHAVRQAADLAYQGVLQTYVTQYPQRFIYQPVVSREPVVGALQGRIPALIAQGTLEQQTGIAFDANAQVMLCGNPNMIHDTRTLLAERGLALNMRRKPGQVTLEQYWAK